MIKGDAEKGKQLLKKMAIALIPPEMEINTLTVQGEVTQFNSQMPGGKMTIRTSSTVEYPDAVEQTIGTPGGTMNLSYKNGSDTLSMMGQEKPLPPQMSQSLKDTLNRNYITVALTHEDLNPQYLGIEEFMKSNMPKLR